MFKVIFFLWRQRNLSRAEFIRYYEEIHAPLMISLVPQGSDFRRNYPLWDSFSSNDPLNLDFFDVMTEVTYPDRQFFLGVLAAASDPAKTDIIAADEEFFEQRNLSKLFVVQEQSGEAGQWERPRVGASHKILRFQKHLNAIGDNKDFVPESIDKYKMFRGSQFNASCFRRNLAILDDPLTFMGGHHNRDGGVPLWYRFDSVDEFWFENAEDTAKARDKLELAVDVSNFNVVQVEEFIS